MNVLKNGRAVHANLECWYDLLDTTLQLIWEMWGDEAEHRPGAPRVDVGLDLLDDGRGWAVCQPQFSTLLGYRPVAIIGAQKGLSPPKDAVAVVVDVYHI